MTCATCNGSRVEFNELPCRGCQPIGSYTMQPGSPHFDGAEAFEAYFYQLAWDRYEMDS